MKELRRLLPYVRDQGSAVAGAFACMLIYAITTAFYAFISGPAFKFIFSGEADVLLRDSSGKLRDGWTFLPDSIISKIDQLTVDWALIVLPIIIVLAATCKGLAQAGQFHLMGKISQSCLLNMRRDVFRALLKQPPGFFIKNSHGDLLSRLTNDANQIEQAVFYGAGPVIREPLVLLSLLGYLFYSDARLAMLTFIVGPISAYPLIRFTKWLKGVSSRGQVAQAEVNAVSYEALAGIQVVHAFGTEEHEEMRLHRAGLKYYREMLVSYFIRAVRTPIMEVLGAMALALLMGVLAWEVRHENADPAHYMSFFAAFIFMYDPLKKLGRVADFLATGEAAAERVFALTRPSESIAEKSDATELPSFSREIQLDAVSFTYGDKPVLSEVSLRAPRGHVVALVGSSGSGKTTLVNLLPRFFDVTGGAIRIDGTDLRDVSLRSLRNQISMVSQDTFLFNATIADNIAYGRPETAQSDIVAAARAAHAHGFVQELRDGYQTVIGERGVTLSGGQRQRIAIARAILRNTPILILDEATSALDTESEHKVQMALEHLMKGRTCFVVAHRLSTIRRATHIAVLKDGAIVEEGNHDELLTLGGEYARLHALQFRDTQPESALSNESLEL